MALIVGFTIMGYGGGQGNDFWFVTGLVIFFIIPRLVSNPDKDDGDWWF
jgi:hypothetical protein